MDSILDFPRSNIEDQQPRKMITIMGIPIDVLDMDEALDRIEEFVYRGRSNGRTHQITTVNADFVVNAIKDPEIRIILQEADLATADGMPIVWASKLLGVPMGDRVAGADMVPLLAERAAKRGFSIYFLGAGPGIAEEAASILKSMYPALNIAGVYSPPFSPIIEMDPSIVEVIRSTDPDILLVAFGNPKQEKWIAMHRYDLKVPVMMGIGGSLDFITGNNARAPRWMQKIGFEWFHRLLQDPRRLWKRYVIDFFVFGSFMFRQWWNMKRYGSTKIILPIEDKLLINNVGILRVSGSLVVNNISEFNRKAVGLLAQASTLIIDFSEATFIDSAAIATLVRLSKEMLADRKQLYLVNLSKNIKKTLELLRLDRYFQIGNNEEEILRQLNHFSSNHHQMFSEKTSEIQITFNGKSWKMIYTPTRFDALSAKQVYSAGLRVLTVNDNLLINMKNTEILTTAGLAILAELQRKGKSTDCEIMLTNVGQDPRKVLELAKFNQSICINPVDLN